MKKIIYTLACVAVALLIACDDTRDTGPAAPQVQSLTGDLIDLLPASTLAAVEIRSLDDRWDELRAIPPLAHLQDRVLAKLGLFAADVPVLAGSHAVVALVSDGSSRDIVPVAVLDPPSPAQALERIAASQALIASEARGAIWAGPVDDAQAVERIAAGDGTSLRQAIDFAVLSERLPDGGLLRAVINPKALGSWLRAWAEFASMNPLGTLARLLAADLDGVEIIGIHRDLVGAEVVTDMWLGIDTEVVPEELTRALATHRGPAALPVGLSTDVIVAKSYRTEPEAGLAWLRALGARDTQGPLRNLDFWIDEFEARSGRNVQEDIVGALGERGLGLVYEGTNGEAIEMVQILEAREPQRLEAALIALRDWLAEQIQGRSLGLATPKNRDDSEQSGVPHGLDFWSPFGSIRGPVFQVTADHLVLATSHESLERGLQLAGSADQWITPGWASGEGPPDEVAVIRTSALARLLGARLAESAEGPHPLQPIQGLLAAVGEARVRVYYDEEGVRAVARLSVEW